MNDQTATAILRRVSPFWAAVRSRFTPAMVVSVVAVIFSAGVAWADLQKASRIAALERDMQGLQSDRQRLDTERERAAIRLSRLEDQGDEHERKWRRVEEAAEVHIAPRRRSGVKAGRDHQQRAEQ